MLKKLILFLSFILSAFFCFTEDYNKLLLQGLKNENLKKVENALKKGADPDIENNYGMPAIVIAAAFGNIDLVKLFIEYKADINAVNNAGGTALHYAAMIDRYDIAKLLIDNGIDINIIDTNHETPIFHAVYKKNYELVKLLLEKGIKINIRNNKKFTPLMIAAQEGNTDIIKLLIDYKANVHIARSQGGTALVFAADRGHIEAARVLLEAGADINGQDNILNISALMDAAYMGQFEMVKFLVENGADINLKDYSGNTAINYAERTNKYKIVNFLKTIKEYSADNDSPELINNVLISFTDLTEKAENNEKEYITDNTFKLSNLTLVYFLNNNKKIPGDINQLKNYYNNNKKSVNRSLKKISKYYRFNDINEFIDNFKNIVFIKTSYNFIRLEIELDKINNPDETYQYFYELKIF